jgi:thioredoxin-dependent peroxiredoxin
VRSPEQDGEATRDIRRECIRPRGDSKLSRAAGRRDPPPALARKRHRGRDARNGRKEGDMTIDVGATAPLFTLPTDGGGKVDLAGLAGKKVVVYFYPKADTSACTKEAIEFSQAKADFAGANTVVIGVSGDPVKALDKFRDKYTLDVTLASADQAMFEAWGVWVEKSMYGKKYMGLERATFLVGADGKVAKAWRKVKVDGHVADVLKAAKAA